MEKDEREYGEAVDALNNRLKPILEGAEVKHVLEVATHMIENVVIILTEDKPFADLVAVRVSNLITEEVQRYKIQRGDFRFPSREWEESEQ